MPGRRRACPGHCGRYAGALLPAARKTLAIAAAAFALAASATASAAGANAGSESGRKLFIDGAVPACGLCHTLRDAGTEGAIGPVLDELRPDTERVAKALRDGIGQMPSYKASLSGEEIEAIAVYVSRAAGASR